MEEYRINMLQREKIRYLQEIFEYAHMLLSYILAYLHNIIRIIMITHREEKNEKKHVRTLEPVKQ